MSGQSTAEAWMPEAAVAKVPLVAIDSRVPVHFSSAEHDAALAELSRKAGPLTEAIVTRVNASFESHRAELNAAAGGQASDRVMLLAHNAQRAQLAVELQTTVSIAAHGAFVQADNMKREEQVAKGLRNLVGICAFATDLLNKAHAAALEEGRAKSAETTATDRLLTAIGVEAPTQSPLDPPGGVQKGPLPSSTPASPKTNSGESE